jgi:hypothetical protein
MVKKKIIHSCAAGCMLLLQAFITGMAAQASGNAVNQADTALAGDKESIHSFYVGTGYGSNLLYLGTTMSQDHGFGYASTSYGLADKLYLSATGYTVSDFTPFTAFYSLGLSYNHTLNSWFDVSTSLSRYNVAASLRDTLFSNFTYADATLGFDWRILYSKLSAGGLFAGGSQFYLQTKHSRYFETPSFASGKAFFSFDPYVNILFGNMLSVKTVGGTIETTVSPGYRPWGRDSRTTTPGTVYSETFGLMEIDFGIPVAFNYDFLSLEIEPGYIIPLYSDEGASGTKGFLLMTSLFFRIF